MINRTPSSSAQQLIEVYPKGSQSSAKQAANSAASAVKQFFSVHKDEMIDSSIKCVALGCVMGVFKASSIPGKMFFLTLFLLHVKIHTDRHEARDKIKILTKKG